MMSTVSYRFSDRSHANLATASKQLTRLACWVLGIKDHSILKGHRGEVEQDAAFASGASQLQWPHGKHNDIPSRAIDVQAYPRPLPLMFEGDPDTMSLEELRREVKSLRRRFENTPLREEQHFLLGAYQGVAAVLGVPIRTGNDWDRDGELHDNGFDDLFHVELR